MTLVEFIRAELRRLHHDLDAAVDDLTPEQWHTVAGEGPATNHIAFVMWHFARSEDNIVRFILQNRRPTVWMEGGWVERLGLPPIAQGTGMPPAEARALRIVDLDDFRRYVRAVWESADDYLAHVDPSALDATVMVRPLGEMPAIRALGQVCLTHGFTHLGEIEVLRTLQGLGSSGGL